MDRNNNFKSCHFLPFYRSAKSTLAQRCRKKLIEKTTWYKDKKRKREDDAPPNQNPSHSHKRMRKEGEPRRATPDEEPTTNKVKGVLFVPYTPGGELAKRMREAEAKLETLTGYKLKVVERAGTKLVDILTKSDPWQGADCGREDCLLCLTKAATGKNKTQDCTRRNLVYETWCINCLERDEEAAILRLGTTRPC